MTKVTKYEKPYPKMTDAGAGYGGVWCPGARDGWSCTRPKGHEGDHEAGGLGGIKLASWPRKVH